MEDKEEEREGRKEEGEEGERKEQKKEGERVWVEHALEEAPWVKGGDISIVSRSAWLGRDQP